MPPTRRRPRVSPSPVPVTPSMTTEERVAAWRAVGVEQRKLLRLMAAHYAPVSQVLLDREWHLRRRPRTPDLGTAINGLVVAGLVEVDARREVRVHPDVTELAMRDAVAAGEMARLAAEVRRRHPETWRWLPDGAAILREIRLALYLRQVPELDGPLQRWSDVMGPGAGSPLWRIVANPFDGEWLEAQPEAFRSWIAEELMGHACSHRVDARAVVDWCAARDDFSEESDGFVHLSLTERLVLEGRFDEACALAEENPSPGAVAASAWARFLQGRDVAALELFDEAVAMVRRADGSDRVFLHARGGLFHVLCLLRRGRVDEAADLARIGSQDREHPLRGEVGLLQGLVAAFGVDGESPVKVHPQVSLAEPGVPVLVSLLAALFLAWTDVAEIRRRRQELVTLVDECAARGLDWPAAELAAVLAHAGESDFAARAREMRERLGTPSSLCNLLQEGRGWERVLDALQRIAPGAPPARPEKPKRVGWTVQHFPAHGRWRVTPREQRQLAAGDWRSGRELRVPEVLDPKGGRATTSQDLALAARLQALGGRSALYDAESVLEPLIGHPAVSWAQTGLPLEIAAGEPELRLEQSPEGLLLRLHPDADGPLTVVPEGPRRLRLYRFSDEHLRVARLLREGLRLPAEAAERAVSTVSALAGTVAVRSDLGGGTLREVPADPRLFARLSPHGDGLRVEVEVRPLASASFPPGQGARVVMDRECQATRDLEGERAALEGLVAECPALDDGVIADPADALEALHALESRGESVVLEWPEGARWTVRTALDAQWLELRSAAQWFEVHGALPLDDGRVVELKRLLEAVGQARGRFVPLGDGQFVALERSLLRRMCDLAAFADTHGKAVRFHPLAAPALQDLLGDARADEPWNEHLRNLAENPCPSVPAALQAELRDYQRDGFQWLARMSHWGAGACLADDMGLGKTVQAIAAILQRAADGPTLVVAPTSVCPNWIAEMRRFAPTLRPVAYEGAGRSLQGCGPQDVVVTSYALLHRDEEALSAVQWRTAILDEAQAIKNHAARRSQAAMRLPADFRMILSGTPVENHLSELWTLFRFVNPGLLGSREQFNARFARPIEAGDAEARGRLKRLVAPFILRRLKSQVLEQLPPRTDVVRSVVQTEGERALYEAVRQRAMESLAGDRSQNGQRHVRVLAELMKLRRACCHPRLVLGEAPLPSSKLEALDEILDELRENGHRALIFSQFTDHLAVVREHLEGRGVSWLYLDGSTPVQERKRLVDAFQGGEGEVFLISLKAGGTGLNLTGADYVVHLDPWWNPAVEDQASDRAHRIGQERPVTVYRMVARDTVEERIVALHGQKRDLADSILAGTDAAVRLSADDLIRLIREEGGPVVAAGRG